MKRYLFLSLLTLAAISVTLPAEAAPKNKKKKPTRTTKPAVAKQESSEDRHKELLAELDALKTPPAITVEGITNTNQEFDGTLLRESNGYIYLRNNKGKTGKLYPANIVDLKVTLPEALQSKLEVLENKDQALILGGLLLKRRLYSFTEYYLLNHYLGGKLATDQNGPIVELYKTHKRTLSPLFGGRLPRDAKTPQDLLPRIMPCTRDSIEANVKKAKELGKSLLSITSSTHLIETDHFLIYSTWPKANDSALVKIFNRLYSIICKQYLMDPREHIWVGKLPVYACWTEKQFKGFCTTAFGHYTEGAGGFAARRGDFGYVVLGPVQREGTSKERAKQWFAQLLSHEASHAFVARYLTGRPIPNWLNEGMAEIVAESVQPRADGFRKLVKAHEAIKKGERLSTSFFTQRIALSSEAYGSAQSITRFLAKTDSKAFIKFIQEIKQGEDVEGSLQSNFKMDYKTLLARWHKAVLNSR